MAAVSQSSQSKRSVSEPVSPERPSAMRKNQRLKSPFASDNKDQTEEDKDNRLPDVTPGDLEVPQSPCPFSVSIVSDVKVEDL